MTLIRVMTTIPETFEDLSPKLIWVLPKVHLRVDMIADCYFENKEILQQR